MVSQQKMYYFVFGYQILPVYFGASPLGGTVKDIFVCLLKDLLFYTTSLNLQS